MDAIDIVTDRTKGTDYCKRILRIGLAIQVVGVEYDNQEIDENTPFAALDHFHHALGKLIKEMKKYEGA